MARSSECCAPSWEARRPSAHAYVLRENQTVSKWDIRDGRKDRIWGDSDRQLSMPIAYLVHRPLKAYPLLALRKRRRRDW
jgi:hypothetical protein